MRPPLHFGFAFIALRVLAGKGFTGGLGTQVGW